MNVCLIASGYPSPSRPVHNIFIHEDPDLIEVLSCLDINKEIPPNLYLVVAELLAFVYALNGGEKFQ